MRGDLVVLAILAVAFGVCRGTGPVRKKDSFEFTVECTMEQYQHHPLTDGKAVGNLFPLQDFEDAAKLLLRDSAPLRIQNTPAAVAEEGVEVSSSRNVRIGIRVRNFEAGKSYRRFPVDIREENVSTYRGTCCNQATGTCCTGRTKTYDKKNRRYKMEMVVEPKPFDTMDCAEALVGLHGGGGAHGEHSQPLPQQPQHHQPQAPQLPQTQASSSSSNTAASTCNQQTAGSASRKRASTDDESPSLPLNSDRCPKSLFCSRRLEMGAIADQCSKSSSG
ncbi:unnamed protein product [Calypogeia fissa]